MDLCCHPTKTLTLKVVAIADFFVEHMNVFCIVNINALLHEYADYIIGRMGIPYKQKGICIISVAIDATQDIINTLAGKIGRIKGVTAKTVYSKG